jgi:hypothetical protein
MAPWPGSWRNDVNAADGRVEAPVSRRMMGRLQTKGES